MLRASLYLFLFSIILPIRIFAESHDLIVSVASSLEPAIRETIHIADQSGYDLTRVKINASGSQMLAKQILGGAKVDIFISADEKNIDVVLRSGLLTERKNLVSNRMVLATFQNKSLTTTAAKEKYLMSSEVKKVAIGHKSLPMGFYADQLISSWKNYNLLTKKFVYADSARAVTAYVKSGTVDAGFLFETEAKRLGSGFAYDVIEPSDGKPIKIQYFIAKMKRSTNLPEVDRLFEYFVSPAALRVYETFGFSRETTQP